MLTGCTQFRYYYWCCANREGAIISISVEYNQFIHISSNFIEVVQCIVSGVVSDWFVNPSLDTLWQSVVQNTLTGCTHFECFH